MWAASPPTYRRHAQTPYAHTPTHTILHSLNRKVWGRNAAANSTLRQAFELALGPDGHAAFPTAHAFRAALQRDDAGLRSRFAVAYQLLAEAGGEGGGGGGDGDPVAGALCRVLSELFEMARLDPALLLLLTVDDAGEAAAAEAEAGAAEAGAAADGAGAQAQALAAGAGVGAAGT